MMAARSVADGAGAAAIASSSQCSCSVGGDVVGSVCVCAFEFVLSRMANSER